MKTAPKYVSSKHVVVSSEHGSSSFLQVSPCIIGISNGLIESVERCAGDEDYEARCAKLHKENASALDRLDDFLISPAFINAHTHLAMSFFRGIAVEGFAKKNLVEDLFFHIESRLAADDVRAFARMGAYESLLNGVGLVWDHYYYGKAISDALRETGLCGVVAPTLQDLDGPGRGLLEQMFAETAEIASADGNRAAGVFAALGPHATDTVSTALWKRILESAAKWNLPVHGHLAQSREELDRAYASHGCSPVQYLEKLGLFENGRKNIWAHGIHISKSDLQKISKGAENLMVFCPFSQMVFQFPAPVLRWQDAGLNWAVATDCVASNDSMNVQKELRFVAGVPHLSAGFSPGFEKFLDTGSPASVAEAIGMREKMHSSYANFMEPGFLLQRITEVPGRAHTSFVAGAVEKNALANLVVWNRDHPSMWPSGRPLRSLSMGDTSSAIHNMMTVGRWMGSHGNYQESILTRPEYIAARNEADGRLASLLKRL